MQPRPRAGIALALQSLIFPLMRTTKRLRHPRDLHVNRTSLARWPAPRFHRPLTFAPPCNVDIICRMAAVDPGDRFSRHTSSRLQASSIFEKRYGFLNAERHVGTTARMRSHTTHSSPLLSKKSSSLINPRFTIEATISQ